MDNNYDKYSLDSLGIFLTISEISKLSKIPKKAFVNGIKYGYIPSICTIELNEENYEEYLNKTLVPLSECQPHVIINYFRKQIADHKFINFNLNGYRIKYGFEATKKLIIAINDIKEIEERSLHFYDKPANLISKLFEKYGIEDERKYYRLLKTIKSNQLDKLVKETPPFHKSICPLAKDYILNEKYQLLSTDTEAIFYDLIDIKKKNKNICISCPYNPSSKKHKTVKKQINDNFKSFVFKECLYDKKGLVIPNSIITIDRFLKESSASIMHYSRHDKPLWLMYMGHQVVREKPNKFNEVAFGDHHQFDILVTIGNDNKGNIILVRPWVTLQMDMATNAITSSVISLMPNKYSIAECFAKAACITYDSPFYGLPEVFYVDRGKDYKSAYLKGTKKYEMKNDDYYQNRLFFDDPFLKTLNVCVKHARRLSPQTKPIERLFRTLEHKYFRKSPGFIGDKKGKKLEARREQEINRLINSGHIWSYEKFINYWFKYVVPHFNNWKVRGKLSPIERYQKMERANTFTPSWSLMSIYMQEKHKVLVTQQGIKHNKQIYYSPVLDDYIDKEVLVFDFNNPKSNDVVAYYTNKELGINKCLGLIPIVEKLKFIEDNPVKYARNLSYVNMQERIAKDNISAIKYIINSTRLSKKIYDEYDETKHDIYYTYFSEKPKITKNELTNLSPDELRAKKIMLEKELDIITELVKEKSNDNDKDN